MASTLDFEDYTVAWIAVLAIEAQAALGMLDSKHEGHFEYVRGDDYIYIGGRINGHNVVIATLPEGQNYGVGSAAVLAGQVKARFPNIWFALLVGVAAGLPNLSPKDPTKKRDIRLGDVLVCVPGQSSYGIIQYDLGKDTEQGFVTNNRQAETPAIVRSAIGNIKLTKQMPFKNGNMFAKYLATFLENDEDKVFFYPGQQEDQFFEPTEGDSKVASPVKRPARDEIEHTQVWYGNIGSGNSLIRNTHRRDELRDKYDLIGLEMEAAGVMNTLPTGVIRGVCDYGNSQKNKIWQPYAAAVAAVYAKGILYIINPKEVETKIEMRRLSRQLISNARAGDRQLPLLSFNDAPMNSLSKNFTGREEELNLISSIFQPKTADNPLQSSNSAVPTRCALYGRQAVGKTQLALKYATLSFDTCRYSSIFWISAASTEKLYQGITRILALVRHPDRDHQDQSLSLIMAKRWLEVYDLNEDVRWLLIVDDVHQSALGLLQEFLPSQNLRGNIIITTLTEDIAGDIVDISIDRILEVHVPNPTDAAILFYKTAGIDAAKRGNSYSQFVDQLVKCVDCLPLAVAQAASFMKVSRKTPSEMLSLYQSSEKFNHLNWNIPNNNFSPYKLKSVAAVFEEQFKQIAALPDANILLQLLSFFDPERIQLDIISRGCKESTGIRSSLSTAVANDAPTPKSNFAQRIVKRLSARREVDRHDQKPEKGGPRNIMVNPPLLERLRSLILSPAQLQGALHQLKDRSLVTFLNDLPTLSLQMPGLTKFMVQELTMDHNSRAAIFEMASSILCNAFRLVEDRTSPRCWLECESIVPHIEALTKWLSSQQKTNSDIVWANMEVAEYSRSRGRYKDAERLYRQVMGKPEDEGYHALNSTDAIRVLRGLAAVLVKHGQYNEAESLYQKALAKNKTLRPDSDLDSLITARGLVDVYDKQGRYQDAIDLGEIILNGMRQKTTKSIPDLLQTMHNLGLAYGHQAKYEKAEEMFHYVLVEREKTVGLNHPETLRTVNALANLYDRQCHSVEAAKLYIRAVKGRSECFGSTHPQTLRSVCGLANLYMRNGLLKEAGDLYKIALDESEKYFTGESPDVLRAVHGIASVLIYQEDFIAAEKQFKRAIAGRTDLLGKDHADTLRSIEGLANVFAKLDQHYKAVELYRRVLIARTEFLGTEHPETLQGARDLEVLEEKISRTNATAV